jgi:hypothetical protein
MRWEDINTSLLTVIQHGKTHTKRMPRPWEAMPRWFKRWVKRLNEQHRLQENLNLRPKKRRGNGWRRKLATT